MTEPIANLILLPIDGSANALKAVDYLARFLGPSRKVSVHLLYVTPALPPVLVEESRYNRETAVMLEKMAAANSALAKSALADGRQRLLECGFEEDRIQSTLYSQAMGVARDICSWAENKSVDAIAMSSRGRGRLESFFMGATATKVIDASGFCPIWIVLGNVTRPGVLIAVDRSKEAQRAVDHAGFILSKTDQPITLFYSKRSLTSLIPRQVADSAPEMEKIWQDRSGKDIAPAMEKARRILNEAGVSEDRITVCVTEGTRSPAADIVKTAKRLECGTIVVGRRGSTGQSAFRMGSVSRSVMEAAEDTAVWIVP